MSILIGIRYQAGPLEYIVSFFVRYLSSTSTNWSRSQWKGELTLSW